jgi:hypothetical protein
VTSTDPDDPAGDTAVKVVDEVTLNDTAAAEPNLTAVAPLKPLPVTVTEVPPAIGPVFGLTEETVGIARPINVLMFPLFELPASRRYDSP